MDSVASKYVSVFQKRFPNAIVAWEKTPDAFFENTPCKLTVSRKDNPGIKGCFDFQYGVGESPDIEYDLETFISHYSEILD